MKKLGLITLTGLFIGLGANAQDVPNSNSNYLNNLNTISTSVPFLLIAPDSRAGAMGDVGVATSPDHTYEIKSLSMGRVAGFLVVMLTKAIVASMLLVSGTVFLVNTINIETLLLNTAALEVALTDFFFFSFLCIFATH